MPPLSTSLLGMPSATPPDDNIASDKTTPLRNTQQKRQAQAFPIFMYHNIARVPRGLKRWRGLYVSPGAFARQMGLLKRLGYTGLSMSEAMPYLRGERHGRIAVVTLDDGYLDNLQSALPVLKRYGFTATCYVVSGSIGRYNQWDCEKLGIQKPLMTFAQLRAWREDGMEIGAHTRTHPRLSQCSDAQLQDEIAGSKADLEKVFGEPVTQFCYPYGDLNDRVAETTRAAGYVAATTTQRGHATFGHDVWRLPRVQIARHHLLPQFAMRAFTNYENRRA